MEIHASSQTTYKMYRQSYLLSRYEGNSYKFIINVSCIILILSLVLLIFNFYYIIFKSTKSWSSLSNFPVVSFTLFITYLPIKPKIGYKSQKKILTMPNDFTFYEDKFHVVAMNAQYSETTIIKYSFLEKAYETDENLYLYINNETAFPICKNSINSNEIDELRTRLISYLGLEKYLRRK